MHTPTCPGIPTHARTNIEICNSYLFTTATMIREVASVLRYVYIVCLVFIRVKIDNS